MILLRALLFNMVFVGWTILIGFLALPLLIGPRSWVIRFAEFWTRSVFFSLRWVVGLDYELRGRENLPAGPAILAIKHQSMWDTMVLNQLVRDPAIVYKRELFRIPIYGWYLRAAGGIGIDRQGRAKALRAMLAEARAALAAGRSILIFPEGTRGPVGGKLPYKPGVGLLYQQLNVPLVPVALNSGLFWGRRSFMTRPGRILIEIMPAIPPGLDRREALSLVETQIEARSAALLIESGYTPPPVDNPVDKLGAAR